MILILFFIILFLLCWGSFLNSVAYRLVSEESFWKTRSFCPKCKKIIAWYDNIPILSWIILRGRCRNCNQTISILYPLIEIFTTISLLSLWHLPSSTYVAYFIFFSALIVTIRSDLETMLISRFVTLFLIPLGLLFALSGFLPISFANSLAGAILGYASLYSISKLFYWITKKKGIGDGDLELLAFIGSFIGLAGCWTTLFLGAFIGSIIGMIYIIAFGKSKQTKLPFGPFLAVAAMLYILFQEQLLFFLFGSI